MFALDNLAQRVKAHSSLEDCLVLMFQGIADEIVNAGTNQANLTALVEALRAKDNALAAAVMKNLDPGAAVVGMSEQAFLSEEARRLGRDVTSFTEEEKARIRKDYATRPSFHQPAAPYPAPGLPPSGYGPAPYAGAPTTTQGAGAINRGEDRSRVVAGPAPVGDGVVRDYGPASTPPGYVPWAGPERRISVGVSPTGVERRRPQ